jgi:cytochrome P450
MKHFEGIPGPTPSYPLGTLWDFHGADPWEVCANYEKKYGGMTLVWFGGQPRLVLNDPDLIREVLIEKTEDYYKDEPIKALKPVLKNTLFNLNSPEWDSLRKPHAHPLLIEGFRQWLPSQFPVIKNVVDRHLQKMLASNQELNMVDLMQRIFFDIFNSCVCGPDFKDGGFDNFYEISVMATRRMQTPQFLLIPPIKPSFHKSMSLHYGAYEKAVAKAKQNPDPEANDLLSVFLRQGTEISEAQIVDFLSEFHAGGNISAGAAIVNLFYQLNENPDFAKRLYAELIEESRRKPELDLASVEACTLVDHALRESLRLIPPVPLFGRNVRKDRTTKLGDRELPPDTVVMIVMKAVQRSGSHWKNPDAFDPDRWANGGVEANPVGSDYFFPFGRGPRMCAGAEVAMFCMKIILASVLSKAAVKTSGSFRDVFHCGVIEAEHLKTRLIPHEVAANTT